MKQYFDLIFGSGSRPEFWAAITFASIGLLLRIVWEVSARDKSSDRTPIAFDWKFFWQDKNKGRIISSVILIFIGIRFSQEIAGYKLTMYWAFGVGLFLDILSGFLKDRGLFGNKPDMGNGPVIKKDQP